MIVGIARLQFRQLSLQIVQLLLERLRVGRILRRLPRRHLLRQQRFGVGLVLLLPVQRLGVGIQLGIQSHQDLQIVVLISRQLSHIPLLESRYFGVKIVQMTLGVFQPSAQYITRAAGRLVDRLAVIANHRRSQFVADVLRDAWVRIRVAQIKARHRTALPRLLFHRGADLR